MAFLSTISSKLESFSAPTSSTARLPPSPTLKLNNTVPDCPETCPNGVDFVDWQTFSQIYQQYLTYCALVAAGNLPAEGPFQPLGVYIVNTDADYQVPADAFLILWDVPGQTDTRFLDFSNIEAGQAVQIFVQNSNGNLVQDLITGGGVFSLNGFSPKTAVVHATDDLGSIILFNGNAAQFDVSALPAVMGLGTAAFENIGTSGGTVPLLNGNWVRSGTTVIFGSVTIEGSQLTINRNDGVLVDLTNNIDANSPISVSAAGALDKFVRMIPSTNTRLALGQNSIELLSFNPGATVTVGRIPDSTPFQSWKIGVATLVAGTATVADTAVTAGSAIIAFPGFTPLGNLSYTINPGVGFSIVSDDGTDAGPVSYQRTVL